MNDSTTKTRISTDVWDKAQAVAERMGLSTPRQAIEAIVRVYADSYTIGQIPITPTPSLTPQVVTAAPQPQPEPQNGLAALDSVLSL